MEVTKQIRRRILFQTILFSVVFLLIGAAFGYYFASREAANQILSELSK